MANLAYENGSSIPDAELPQESEFCEWLDTALADTPANAEVCLRIMDEDEMQALNFQYRHKNTPTNVLSFPCELPETVDTPLLGDLAICAQVVLREAQEQGKSPIAHWAHMTVHGALHLTGHDHIDEQEAEDMELKETQILVSLGFPPPYDTEVF